MPEKDKLVTYEKIRQHMEEESIFSRLSFYVKVWVYSVFLLFIFFGIFNFQLNSNKPTINTTYANHIGKILTSTGDFQILENGKTIKWNLIKKWSILKIDKNSHLTIQVNNWIKLYVVWPAKIKFDNYSINKEDIYLINMIDWHYLTVKSNSAKDKIVIKSDYLNIQSNDQFIDLKYEKSSNITVIENNWGNIIVQKNEKVLSLDSKEKLIILPDNDIQHIKNIFSDNYKKYQLVWSGYIKEVITADEAKRLSNILEKRNVIIATWKFVLWKLNKDKKWEESWKKSLIKIIQITYDILWIKIPKLLKQKIQTNQITAIDMQNLLDYLLSEIEKKYVIPADLVQRLKVILAYLVIVEKIQHKTNQTFSNLSHLVNYLKLDDKYKKMLLKF